MMTLTPPQKNGSTPHAPSEAWLQASVQSFFASLNWDDNPPEVQQVRLATSNSPLDLTLSVSQFFTAVNWDGSAIAAPTPIQAPISAPKANDLTLDDFSSLF
jgi:hypothetical protein